MVSDCRKFRERFRSAYATLLPEHLFSHNHDTLQSASKHIDGGLWGKLIFIGVECNTRECADRPQSILYIHRILPKNTAARKTMSRRLSFSRALEIASDGRLAI